MSTPPRPQRWDSAVADAPAPSYGPQYQPSGPQPVVGVPPTAPPAQRTNGLAIAGFVLALLGGGILGLIFGIIARRQIDRSGGAEKGRGLATAAIVISCVWLVLIAIIFIAVAASDPGSSSYYSTY